MSFRRPKPSRRSRPAAAFLAALALALLAAGSAPAATLHLEGDAGTLVTVDGVGSFPLPLDAPLELPSGRYRLRAEKPGCIAMDQEVDLTMEGSVLRLQLRLMPLSRRDAMLYSGLLAGLGQQYLGRPVLGWTLTAAEVGGLLTAAAAHAVYQTKKDDYLVAYDNYLGAVGTEDVALWRRKSDAAYGEMDDAAKLRDTALIVAAGAVVVGVLDAWLRFPGIEAGPGDLAAPSVPFEGAAAAPVGDGFHLAYRIGF